MRKYWALGPGFRVSTIETTIGYPSQNSQTSSKSVEKVPLQPPGNKKVLKQAKTPKNKYRDYLRKTQKTRNPGPFIFQIPVANCSKFCKNVVFVNFEIFELISTKDMLKKS